MKLEAGKFYKTRDGRKALIVHERKEDEVNFRFIGYVEHTDLGLSWEAGGNEKRISKSDYDLIAEWVEPKRIKGWLNIYKADSDGDYEVGYVRSGDKARSDDCAMQMRIACIEIDVTEGEGL